MTENLLKEPLLFEDSKRPELAIEFPDKEDQPDILTMRLRGRLTPVIAEALGVSYLFLDNGVSRDGFKQLQCTAVLKDVELKFSSPTGDLDTYYPEKIDRMVVNHSDAGLTISMRISMTGNFDPIADFFRRNRLAEFSFTISARQGELFSGGERIDMSDSVDKQEALIQ